MAPRIFISHKSSDLATVERVVRLLVEATGVRKNEIRCTSVPGCTLPIGADVPATLAREIREAAVFVCLITRDAAQSAYVLSEAGARWGVDKKVLPLVAPGISPTQLPPPIAHRHAARMASKTDLLQFVREVAQELGVPLRSGNAYERTLAEIVRFAGAPAANAIAATVTAVATTQREHGFCIRCRDEIPFDTLKPYCLKDFTVWARYEDPYYEDQFCHRCGKAYFATMMKPLCGPCYRATLE